LTLGGLIERYGLVPHPFEGSFKAVDGGYLQALSALDEAAWHRAGEDMVYRLMEGGPVAISISSDGETAEARRLSQPGDEAKIPAEAARTLSCLGSAALLHVGADLPPSMRYLLPDDWYPKG
jgi:hypothetical protein